MTTLDEQALPASEGIVAGTPLIELEELVVEYALPGRRVRAVDGVSLTVHAGEIVGLAGESGCGKSTAAHAILRILRPPAEIASGRILFRGEDAVGMSEQELRRSRSPTRLRARATFSSSSASTGRACARTPTSSRAACASAW